MLAFPAGDAAYRRLRRFFAVPAAQALSYGGLWPHQDGKVEHHNPKKQNPTRSPGWGFLFLKAWR